MEKTDIVRIAFGQVLRNKRKQRGWSQEELAFRAGIAMRYVSLLECNNRQPTISTIYSLCEALEVSMAEFLGEVEQEVAREQ